MNPFIVISILLWIAVFVYWLIRSQKQGIMNEIAGLIKLALSGLIIFIPVIFLSVLYLYKPLFLLNIIGTGIVAFGFILCIVSREYLAQNWSGKVVIQAEHTLVQNGPYKILRHPIYSGVLIMMLGSSLLAGNLLGFVWFVFSFFGLYRKSKQEEELLITKFGDSYEQYKKSTSMIIPKIL
ncbi:MAG: isoprenylcysteine carboxylmethyltransferase family protein [Treponema sp.]|nr:isoprenylcysteine carboxylmethyltransferase family protein [Treponema sp.]